MRKLAQIKIKDPGYAPKASPNALDRFFISLIRDKRDLPFVYLCLQITLTLIPSAVILYLGLLNGWAWYVHATVHFLLCVGYFLGPFTLMLHNTSHREFFKKEYGFGNYYIPFVLGIFMGQPPKLYFYHHIGMHHSEGNLPEDRSSTMPFQRDSILGFLAYFGRFMIIGWIDLMNYFLGKRKKVANKMMIRTGLGEWSFYAACAGLCFIHWQSTLFIFIMPLVFVRLGMMSGNWSQHAFVDQAQPDNDYVNSITCINTRYNKMCFNDGYHIGHHLYPNMHWTEMPGDFLKKKDLYAQNKAVVFEGLDYHQIFFLLMFKRYNVLAKHFVDINDQYKSDEEVIALLKSRTQKFSKESLANYAAA